MDVEFQILEINLRKVSIQGPFASKTSILKGFKQQSSQHRLKNIQDILKEKTGHFTGLQKPISVHLLGIIVSWQYSISSNAGVQQQ